MNDNLEHSVNENKVDQSSASSVLDISQLNQHIATRIYQRFTQGKVINKLHFHRIKSALIDDKDYTYLFRFQREFECIYALMGKKLVHHVDGEFYYIDNVAESDSDEADEHALKTQSIILLLARHYELTGRGLHQLSDPSTGFNHQTLNELNENEEYKAIIRALKFSNWEKAIEYLVKREFAFATDSQGFVLSSAGTAFCHQVLDAYDKR